MVKNEENINTTESLYVLPAFQSQGVGGSLIEKAFTWLGAGKDIHVDVVTYNEQAINFYQKHGFVKRGKRPLSDPADFPSGKSFPGTEMVRKN